MSKSFYNKTVNDAVRTLREGAKTGSYYATAVAAAGALLDALVRDKIELKYATYHALPESAQVFETLSLVRKDIKTAEVMVPNDFGGGSKNSTMFVHEYYVLTAFGVDVFKKLGFGKALPKTEEGSPLKIVSN